jgi:hypothetical protein
VDTFCLLNLIVIPAVYYVGFYYFFVPSGRPVYHSVAALAWAVTKVIDRFACRFLIPLLVLLWQGACQRSFIMSALIVVAALLGFVLTACTPVLVNRCLGMLGTFGLMFMVALCTVSACEPAVSGVRVVSGLFAGLFFGIIVLSADYR